MMSFVIILTLLSVDIEVSAGMICPASSITDGPSVFFQPGAAVPVSPEWQVVASVPFWKISNFDPSSALPDYTDIPSGVPYTWYQFYEESFVCYEVGVRRETGPVTMQALAGVIQRTFELGFTGDSDAGVEIESFETSDFTGSLSASLPAGSFGFMSAAVRFYDSEWSYSLSTGLSISRVIGGF